MLGFLFLQLMKNFITSENWSKNELQDILDYAKDLKINKSINAITLNTSVKDPIWD